MELRNITKAYIKIHKCFLKASPMLSNFLKMIKLARNMSKLRQSLCKKLILTLVHLVVLLCEWIKSTYGSMFK